MSTKNSNNTAKFDEIRLKSDFRHARLMNEFFPGWRRRVRRPQRLVRAQPDAQLGGGQPLRRGTHAGHALREAALGRLDGLARLADGLALLVAVELGVLIGQLKGDPVPLGHVLDGEGRAGARGVHGERRLAALEPV